jgi:hypothetical protein
MLMMIEERENIIVDDDEDGKLFRVCAAMF